MLRYAINPARDLGPRVMIALCGWGGEAFTSHDWWFWIPVVAPHLGGVLGTLLHTTVLEHQWGTQAGGRDKEAGREKPEKQLTEDV